MIAGLPFAVSAALPEVTIEIRNNLFLPQTVTIPAYKKVRLTFINNDPTPEEIDSFDLNREKVIFANSRGTIFVGPLPPGEYRFFGEFHPDSAVGKVLVTNAATQKDPANAY
ncbi:cupredoxin domain-containing protein [Alteromonas gilva]|uniref:Cupredoxin domain-containing protein n=1 Tax=Alteromonas gilva TaxID=2987522 RepID=A0ABT5KWY6_9ALTE|nr:cupredoxin domain-containing protein [Alteromonas gilva]MDC8829275.1 cupredoxin domain-containing protein [Alteromonas gilva]